MALIRSGDGTQLYYQKCGKGKAVVFLAGWALGSDMWEYQTAALSRHGLRCIAYDRRGHGHSDRPAQGYDFDTLADDLAALLETLDLRDVTLVSHSMAGGEVVRYLGRHGAGRVGRIALLAPTLPFLLKTGDNPDGVDGAAFEAMRAAWLRDRPQWLWDNADAFFTAETSHAIRTWLVGQCLHSSLHAWLECNIANVGTDFRAELRRIELPALLIHGDADVSAPLELTARRALQLIPGSRLLRYPDAPHGLFYTHREQVNRDLLGFIRD